jgi:undecaprenyl-diphosphatase
MNDIVAAALRWDVGAFYWVNHGWSRPVLDVFFRFVTELKDYIVPAAALAVYLWIKKGSRGRLTLLTLALFVALADPISSRLIKHWVQRPRPCAALPGVLTPAGVRGTFSFPSSHAVNIGGAALIIALNFPSWSLPAFLLAALVGLSRVYLGLHYPSDVLVGYLIGGAIAWGCWRAVGFIQARKEAGSNRG